MRGVAKRFAVVAARLEKGGENVRDYDMLSKIAFNNCLTCKWAKTDKMQSLCTGDLIEYPSDCTHEPVTPKQRAEGYLSGICFGFEPKE